jgi:hypothetical protein
MKGVIENHNWQTRTANYSTHGSRTGRNNLGWGEEEHLNLEQRRDCLVKKKKKIVEKLVKYHKKHPERKRLGKIQHEIEQQINFLRPKLKSGKGIYQFVFDILREKLTKPEFDALFTEANKRMKEATACKVV